MRCLIVIAAWLSLALTASAEPPNKPAFLQQGDNADLAYCFVILKDNKYRPNPRDSNLTFHYLTRAAYLHSILQERAAGTWPTIRDDVMQWTVKAIEEDLATKGALRLSPQDCLDLRVTESEAE